MKVRCQQHSMITHERIASCEEYPYGAIKIVDKHQGEPCATIIPLNNALFLPEFNAPKETEKEAGFMI